MKAQPHIRTVVVLALLALSLIAAHASLAQAPTPAQCPGAPISRLSSGSLAVVTPGAANNVRSYAGVSNKIVGQLQPGTVFPIMAGPICADGYIWWQISVGTLFGYTAEGMGSTYYVEPYSPPPIATAQGSTVSVNQDGVSFSFDSSIAPAVSMQALKEVSDPEGPGWGIAPAGVEYILFDGTQNTIYPDSTVSIYPAAGFAPLDERTGQYLDALRSLINNQTANSKDTIPEVPILNAAQVIRASIKYLPLADGGKGVRFLTWYAQSLSVATNDIVRYEFRGFSGDGAHYINAAFHVRSSALPDTVDYSTFDSRFAQQGAYDQYLADITQQLTALPADQFAPSLDKLDALVQSISFSNG